MYKRFYGLAERPFSLLPDPDFLFLSKNHRTALDLLELAILNHSGFCVISGEIGSGKTTLIRELLNRLDEHIRVGLVSNTHASFGELLQWVMAAYGLPCGSRNKLELHQDFLDFAIQQYAENKHTLLIIDEAQNLTPAALEELRMLSNVNSEKDFVLQIILVGQQQLRDHLKNSQLQQFAQRIALDYHLENLNAGDTCAYIQHRLEHAGGKSARFSEQAYPVIYEHTHGVPRLINRLCDLCLVYGYAEQHAVIDAELVERVALDQKMGTVSCDKASSLSASAGGDKAQSELMPVAATPVDVATAGTANAVKSDPALAQPDSSGQDESEPVEAIKVDAGPDALHTLVVATERQRKGRGRSVVLWVLLPVVVLAGVVGWQTREDWLPPVQATVQDLATEAGLSVDQAFEKTAEAAKTPALVPETATATSRAVPPVQAAKPQAAHERVTREADKRPSPPVAVPQVTPADTERLAEEQRREQALQREAQRLQQLQQEAQRLEQERQAAERELARQRVQRQALEHEARMEQQRQQAARAVIEQQAKAERLRAKKPPAVVKPHTPAVSPPALAPSAVAAGDGHQRVPAPALDQSVGQSRPAAVDPATAEALAEPDPVRFSSNPCNGPTARFMSTCR